MDSDGMCTVVACKDGSLRVLSSPLPKGFVQASALEFDPMPSVARDISPPRLFSMRRCALGLVNCCDCSATKRYFVQWIMGRFALSGLHCHRRWC